MIILFSLILLFSSSANDIAVANNQFGFNLYNKISKDENTNVIFSPYSMFSVLGLLVGGCKGNSRDELIEVLELEDFEDNEERIHSGMSDLSKSLDETDAVSVNHGLFLSDVFEVYQSYVDFSKKYYDAYVEVKEFPQPGTDEINDWVAEKTNNMIKNLLPELPKLTRAVLVNTIHFKNTWKDQFSKSKTKSHQFAFLGEKNVYGGTGATFMMEDKKMEVFYGEHNWDTRFKSVVLDFQKEGEWNPEYGMIFLLPKKNSEKSLRKLEKSLRKESFDNDEGVIGKLEEDYSNRKKDVHIKLPRFEITWEKTINEILKDLGVEEIFDENKADLSKMADIEKEQLYISMILQKAKIKVDEEGCEAAAASAVVAVATSVMIGRPPKPKTFFAHRPFLYILYHKKTKSILFMGKVLEPELSSQPIEVFIKDYYKGDNREGGGFFSVLIIFGVCLVCCCALVFVGGTVVYYFKFYKKKSTEEVDYQPNHKFQEIKNDGTTNSTEDEEILEKSGDEGDGF